MAESAPGAGDGAHITLVGALEWAGQYGIDIIEFDDGTVWGRDVFFNPTIIGTSGDDVLNGTFGDNAIYGFSGNDHLSGGYGNDTIDGGDGNDAIFGEDGSDTITASAGSDFVDGGFGIDTVIWARGDGNDTVADSGYDEWDVLANSADRLRLVGVLPWQVHIEHNGTDSEIVIDDTAPGAGDGGRVTLIGLSGEGNQVGIDLLEFDDGTVWTRELFASPTMLGTEITDIMSGTANDDVILGEGGNDAIHAGDGNDILVGGEGSDYLGGGYGYDLLKGGLGDDYVDGGYNADTVLWSRGDGDDVISDSGYGPFWSSYLNMADRLRLVGVDSSQAHFEHSGVGTAVVLVIAESSLGAGDGARLTLSDALGDDGQMGVDLVQFDDGVIWTRTTFHDYLLVEPTGSSSLTGTLGDDTLTGTAGNDIIDGLAGNDLINAGEGNDTIEGGTGDDSIVGGQGEDEISGGAGNDSLDGGGSSDIVTGGVGADLIDGGDGDDTIVWARGDGDDIVSDTGYEYFDYEFGFMNNSGDRLKLLGILPSQVQLEYSGSGTSVVVVVAESAVGAGDGGRITVTDIIGSGNASIDMIEFDDGTIWDQDFINNVTMGGNTASGTEGDDTINGGAGDDEVDGGAGDDVIAGGSGDDTIAGGSGSDTITGGAGADVIDGGFNNDTIIWARGDGDDVISDSGVFYNNYSLNNADRLKLVGVLSSQVRIEYSGEGMNVTLAISESTSGAGDGARLTLIDGMHWDALTGIDLVEFDDGTIWTRDMFFHPALIGTVGDDTLNGTTGNNLMEGLAGNDTISGGDGNDTINGESGDDTIAGGSGSDTITGGAGNDILTGNAGDDVFIFGLTSGQDEVTDFAAGESSGDLIDLSAWGIASLSSLLDTATTGSQGVVVHLDQTHSIELAGVQASALTVDDFKFA